MAGFNSVARHKCVDWLPRYVVDIIQSPNWRCALMFHCCSDVGLMSHGALTYTPNAGNACVAQLVFSAGKGLPPGYVEYGSAHPPGGFESVICAPHGGLLAKRVLKNRCGVS